MRRYVVRMVAVGNEEVVVLKVTVALQFCTSCVLWSCSHKDVLHVLGNFAHMN